MTRVLKTSRHETLGRILAARRKAVKMTQTVLADRLGKPQPYVAKYERGRQALDLFELLAVAEVLGCTIEEVISELEAKQASS